jgi:hypothetical protein
MKKIFNILFALAITLIVVSSLSLAFNAPSMLDSFRFGAVAIVALFLGGYFQRKAAFFAAITGTPLYSVATELNNAWSIKSFTQAYAATSALVLKAGARIQHVCYAQLTGAMTINATVTNLQQFDEVVFHFSADGTNRVVTFGTNFVSSGTLTVTASKDATARGIFDGTNIKIVSREVGA